MFFLEKIKLYLLPIADIYAFCLLPNHYHLLLQIKPSALLAEHYRMLYRKELSAENTSSFISHCFSKLQNCYAKSFNNFHNRKGSLFMSPLKRITITDDAQLAATLFYIHKNPVHHGLCRKMWEWKFSSYNIYCSDGQTLLNRKYILDFFGGLEYFHEYHRQVIDLKVPEAMR